ncbi:MAG: T9SS type A sorting domain-containing protein [Chitinophagales bacterium]
MKRTIVFIFVIALCLHGNCQINFLNPSFEGTICTTCTPDNWSACYYQNSVIDSFIAANLFPEISPQKAIDGRNYLFIEKEYPHDFGNVSQSVNCFKHGKRYCFLFFSASTWGPKDSFWSAYSTNGYLTVYLGNDSCDRRQKIYQSKILDSSWHQITVAFQPDSDYSWISFWPENDSLNKIVDIALDALSPIYLINANAVHVAKRDTVIYKRGSEQPCVPLHATSSISTFDTVRWYKLVNDTLKVPVANGFSTTQCLDSSTTFLIGMRDSVIGCAGVEWSWDTVRVWVRDTVLGINEGLQMQEASFQLQPNPVKQMLRVSPLFDGPFNWEISDALGRSILRGNGRDETLVNVEPLQRGAYLMKVEGMVRRFLKE